MASSASTATTPKHGATPKAQASSTTKQEREIYEEVSSLVEELEAAYAKAEATGTRLPRAVEAAAAALEPLLRLRDVTGAFSCDLTLMPWLPELLTVFRNVLHTAVDGISGPPRSLTQTPNADSGAGGTDARGAAATAAAAAAAALSALGSGRSGGPAPSLELETLRQQVRQQDQALIAAQDRESRLLREIEDLKRERAELWTRVKDLDGSSPLRRDQDGPDGGKGGGTWLARRLADLERESAAWRSERQSAEDRISQLVGMVSAAVDEEPSSLPPREVASSPELPWSHRAA